MCACVTRITRAAPCPTQLSYCLLAEMLMRFESSCYVPRISLQDFICTYLRHPRDTSLLKINVCLCERLAPEYTHKPCFIFEKNFANRPKINRFDQLFSSNMSGGK